jgi:hypothetical protein
MHDAYGRSLLSITRKLGVIQDQLISNEPNMDYDWPLRQEWGFGLMANNCQVNIRP